MTANDIAVRQEVDDLPLWRDAVSHDVLVDALYAHDVDEEIFARLLSAYRDHAHKQRPRGITLDFDSIFLSIGGID
jgi:hypothetical protein